MNNSTVKQNLEEGKYYPFKITGSVILPDGSECFVLNDINNVKHLLYKNYYQHYQYNLNQNINCRVDKVNCTGKIFIEPEHPYYKLGEFAEFEFIEYRNIETNGSNIEKVAVFKDIYKKEILVSINEMDNKPVHGTKMKALVEKIKKGCVYISFDQHYNDYSGMTVGDQYNFKITDQLMSGSRYEYLVIQNSSGKEYRIRKKFYSKYGLKTGDEVICEYYENNLGSYLEPIHPHYTVGEKYKFKILGLTHIYEYPDVKKEAYILENLYGKDILLKTEDVSAHQIQNNQISCIVNAIIKSQVFVVC